VTAVKFHFWNTTVDDYNIEAFVTCTRYTDVANNSDKFRRFITIWDKAPGTPNTTPYVFTHTGRWTTQTSQGNWSGGTVRSGTRMSAAFWRRAGANHMAAHRTWVAAKKKLYSGTHVELVPNYDLQRLATRAGLIDTQGTSTTPTQPTQGATVPENHVPQGLDGLLSTLLVKANDTNVDPFDLFADLAVVRESVTDRVDQLDREAMKLRDALVMCNDAIMQRL